MSSEKKALNVAICGAGIFAKERYAPSLKSLMKEGIINVVAIWSRSQQSAEGLRNIITESDQPEKISIYFGEEDEASLRSVDLDTSSSHHGTNLRSLLSRKDIDAVILVVPIMSLPVFIRLSLQYGKHVLSEKPVAFDSKTALELIQLYEKEYVHKNLVWSVAENYRFTESIMRAKEIVSSGTIGRPLICHLEVRSVIQLDNKYFNTEWRKNPSYQGGFLLDGGVHFVALLRTVMGEVDAVTATTVMLKPHLPPLDTIAATFVFDSGAVGTSLITFGIGPNPQEPKSKLVKSLTSPPTLTVHGEKGQLKVTRSDLEYTVCNSDGTVTAQKVQIEHDFENQPIAEEIRTWVTSIHSLKDKVGEKKYLGDIRASPREALQDLLVLESMLDAGTCEEAQHPKNVVAE